MSWFTKSFSSADVLSPSKEAVAFLNRNHLAPTEVKISEIAVKTAPLPLQIIVTVYYSAGRELK